MQEYNVTNCWIEKQHKKDKYIVCIYDEINSKYIGNAYIYFTIEQLEKLKKDIEKRMKLYKETRG